MFQLGISAACAYVRKSLDELTSVEDIGMVDSPDAMDLHKIVEESIVEAAVRVHERASSLMMEGKTATAGTHYKATADTKEKTIINIVFQTNSETVRIVSLKASDSSYVITELIPEDSAEGRKQLDANVRGTYDDPRAVLLKKWANDNCPEIRYYSAEKESPTPTFTIEYVPYPTINDDTIEVCPRLEYAVLNELTAMVMDSLGLHERAAFHREKANNIMEGK